MRHAGGLRVIAFAVTLSAVAPALLAACGVVDHDLLIVVFTPSVFVGAGTAWYARRRGPVDKQWFVDSRRMP
jgi:hypothetical protein